eukprot:TRINITY_DN54862_c0_g1_i1.p1 TRINITY_DN54862_c0_g1~~TRINITY_DN54862_c0_g1_i1.p1  ORF type:complete len:697 (-),score=252.94 TRINITY_DN54862_c0_g1_i1:72-2162(-)
MAPRGLVAAALVALASEDAGVFAATPVSKVVDLLENLKAEVEGDGKSEATAYDKFACFCKSTTESKSTSITSGQDTIDEESATVEEKTATKASTTSELQDRRAKQESLTADLKDTEARCAKEKAVYEATALDLTKAIDGLKGAITAMEGSKGSSFLALRQSVRSSLAAPLAAAGGKQRLAAELLQRLSVDPADPEYKFHSQNIIDTVNELLEEFTDEKNTVDEEWGKTKKSCDDTKASLTEELGTNGKAIDTAKSNIATLEGEIATARGNVVSADAVLQDDKLYLKDLTQLCEARARDWDQRSQMRADELKAISQALEVLSKGVVAQDARANKRALLIATKPAAHAAKISEHNAAPVAFLQTSEMQSSEESSVAAMKLGRVVELLQTEGRRLGATSLSLAASRVSGSPFDKVKRLIQELVERLLKEATAEATKKGMCDTELGKAEQDRDARREGSMKLSAEIAGLNAKEDQLTEELSELSAALDTLRDDLSKANTTRVEEKAENVETLRTAKEGLAAVKEALGVLKAFYKQAAKASSSLLQASPVDEDTKGPGFEGAYQGKQEASSGVIGLLEVIQSDFERTLEKTEAAEKAAAAAYVEFERASKADIKGKETKTTLDEEDLSTTRSRIETALEDLQSQMNLLDDALLRLEALKPTCIDLTMPYEERVAKRDEEIAALKRALCILDTENVEDDCKI